MGHDAHFCVDDPFKVFFAFFPAAGASFHSAKQSRAPLHAFASSLGGFLSLSVLDSGLFIRG